MKSILEKPRKNNHQKHEVIRCLAVMSQYTVDIDRFDIYLLTNIDANIHFYKLFAENDILEHSMIFHTNS